MKHRCRDSARAAERFQSSRVANITQAGVIAALYAALTLLTLTFLGGFAFGPVQLRVSEVVCVLALFTPNAIPGLTIGCALANLIGIALNGSGALGLLDVVVTSFPISLFLKKGMAEKMVRIRT